MFSEQFTDGHDAFVLANAIVDTVRERIKVSEERTRPIAVRFFDDGEDRRAGARRAVFWGTYTSMITGRMTGLRWVTS